ncbi:MAG: sigma-70 family RNA polymerase sigma factor [Treponema sp.]|nr:sigma-70 family RNA polymerase sigma factor [Treponema sp.]
MAIDVAAWYKKYGPMVIRRCTSILKDSEDAMDAVHDVFVNLLRYKERLDNRFPSSLLYTMATNICLNRLRKTKRETLKDFTDDEESLPVTDKNFGKVEAKILIDAILEDESEENRTIYYMYFMDGMTLSETGGACGLSVSGVHKRLEAFKTRAREKLHIGEDI